MSAQDVAVEAELARQQLAASAAATAATFAGPQAAPWVVPQAGAAGSGGGATSAEALPGSSLATLLREAVLSIMAEQARQVASEQARQAPAVRAPQADAAAGHPLGNLGSFLSPAPVLPGALALAMGASVTKRAVVLLEFGPTPVGGKLFYGMAKDNVDLRWWAQANSAPMAALFRVSNTATIALRDLPCVVSALYSVVKEAKVAAPTTWAAWQHFAFEFCFALAGEAHNEIAELARFFEKSEHAVFEAAVSSAFERSLERARAADGTAPRLGGITTAQIASDFREIVASIRSSLSANSEGRGRASAGVHRGRDERRAPSPHRGVSPRRSSPVRRSSNFNGPAAAASGPARRERGDRGRGCSAWYFGGTCSRGCPPESHQCFKARCVGARATDHNNAGCPERDRRAP